jgi:hypothetical protein
MLVLPLFVYGDKVYTLVQNLVATQLGVQKISGITMYAVQEKKYYEPLPDIEVTWRYQVQLICEPACN